jgi:hypothetical protein
LDSAAPVSIAAWVRPGTAGLTRTSTRWCEGASRRSRSTSSYPSITISPDSRGERVAEVLVALGVSVEQDVGRIEVGCQRDRELAGGGDVAAQSLLGEHALDGRAREGLRREVDVSVGVARAEGLEVLAGGLPQPLLVDHEGRSAELGRDRRERAAAHGQAAVARRGRGTRQDL